MIFHNGCGAEVLIGDCLSSLHKMPEGLVQTCVTSPPYFGLRDYGIDEQIGLEATPAEFVARLVERFREVRRVLRDDGTLWLNLGDSYASSTKGSGGTGASTLQNDGRSEDARIRGSLAAQHRQAMNVRRIDCVVPDKNLLGIPWRVAFALQADGWYLRQDIIWSKPNPMPESVRDRCTKSHEYLFLLSKSPRYYWNAASMQEPAKLWPGHTSKKQGEFGGKGRTPDTGQAAFRSIRETRNRRSVWEISLSGFAGSHFATFPPALIEPCILACSKPGDLVIDPFGGSGTTAGVALKHGRHALLCELNPEYAAMTEERVRAICA